MSNPLSKLLDSWEWNHDPSERGEISIGDDGKKYLMCSMGAADLPDALQDYPLDTLQKWYQEWRAGQARKAGR